MLLMDIFNIKAGVMALLLTLDGIVYNFICGFYDIFLALARLNLFSNEDYQTIVQRIYIIIGVVMLFTLSYSLLRAVISPDEYSKGEKSAFNIVKNIIISLVIIVILPTIFSTAYRIQAVILNSDLIGKIILNQNVGTNAIRDGGNTIAVNVFRAFFQVNPDAATGDYSGDYAGVQTAVAGAFDEVSRGGSFYVFNGKYDFNGTEYNFPKLVADNVINYSYIISTIAGGFVLWCILLFCFDLGIRAIKLIFYQMIAPVAVVCRVIPGSKTKDVFNNWVKLVVATFLEVFIRVFVMYLGVYLITLLVDKFPDIAAAGSNMGLGRFQRILLRAFLIMGLVAFIRQAPKLIQDVFGFDTKGMNLGLKGLTERVNNGGGKIVKGAGFATAGFIGSAAGGFGQRLKLAKAAGRTGWKAYGSAIAGGFSAGRRSFMSNMHAKNVKEFKENTKKGIADMNEKAELNDYYRAKYGSVVKGKGTEALRSAGSFLGIGANLDAMKKEKEAAEKLQGFYNTMKGYVQDDEYVANYEGMYQAELKSEVSRTDFDEEAYNNALKGTIKAMESDSRYDGLSWDERVRVAQSQVDRSAFTREISEQEYQARVNARAERLKMYSNLKKIAEVRAVNKKLNEKENGQIVDGRFREIAESMNTFKNEKSQYDFVKNADIIDGIQWKSEWDTIMESGNASDIDSLLKGMKDKTNIDVVPFLADSEIGKNTASNIGAEMAKEREKQQTAKDKS